MIQREYSGVSLYEYYYNKDDSNANAEVKLTDAGRIVYGGGGITPDFEIPETKLNRFQRLLARRYAFFNFSKRYLAENRSISRSFEADDAVLERFRAFLREEQVAFEESDLTANLDYIRHSIKLQLYLSVFGMDEAYKLEVGADTQIQKAIELLPQAAALSENAKQVIARKK